MSAAGKTASSGPWLNGCDSYSDATLVNDQSYRWGVNVVSRGGLPRTRPGLNCIPVSTIGRPRGIKVFTDGRGTAYIVVAIGSQVLYCPYPFTAAFAPIPGLSFATLGPVVMTRAIVNVEEAADGTLALVAPRPVLMISDGESRTAYWDGLVGRHLDPSKAPNGPSETPAFKWMEFSGNRLWGSDGSRLRASNLANPLKFTEEDVLAEGGSLNFAGDITGLGQTPDFKSLIVFTDQTTSQVQSGILDRAQWGSTAGFQSVVLPNIGCAAGKSVCTQYGITWWYSHGGLIGLDQAIQTYRTSRIHFQDQAMNWSKGNLSPDISGIALGTFENYLLVSAPSGDVWNAHTWVMDQVWAADQAVTDVYAAVRAPTWNGLWTGVRPVEWVTATVRGQARCFCLSYDYPPTTLAGMTITGAGIDTANGTWVESGTYLGKPFYIKAGDPTDPGFLGPPVVGNPAPTTGMYWNGAGAWVIATADLGPVYIGFASVPTPDLVENKDWEIISNGKLPLPTVTILGADVVPQNNVWEAFIGERVDVGRDADGRVAQKRVSCSLETKVLGSSADYKEFRYVEVDCEDMAGQVDVSVSFAPLRGGYKRVLSKRISADQWDVVAGATTIMVDTFQWASYRPQSRLIRTVSEQGDEALDSQYEGVESNYPRQEDHGFSVLVEWTGQMSVRAVRLTMDETVQDPEGANEEDETTARRVQMSGLQSTETTEPPNLVDGLRLKSAFVASNTRRWTEAPYQSLS